MSGIPSTTKTLLAMIAMSAALVACGQRDAGQAAGTPGAESRSATAASADTDATSAGTTSAGAAGTTAGAAGGAENSTNDTLITTKAKTALLADTRVAGTDINVETNRGVVVLSGAVEDRTQIEQAASIVRGIDGVKSVDNRLRVERQQ